MNIEHARFVISFVGMRAEGFRVRKKDRFAVMCVDRLAGEISQGNGFEAAVMSFSYRAARRDRCSRAVEAS